MKRNYSNKIKVLLCVIAILPIFLYRGVMADINEPGGAEDPLITKSFVEELINGLKDEIGLLKDRINALEKDKIDVLNNKISSLEQANANMSKQIEDNKNTSIYTVDSFKTVYIEANNEVYLEEGTEIILRSGKVVAISDKNQGFADITSGIDTFNNGNIIKNHLLLCPKKDTRHLKVMTNSYFMIKGNYSLKEL